tara:strand:+ start:209 stop:2047 length:1839 start_codon:yes stop_codon:yes gene_type:complete
MAIKFFESVGLKQQHLEDVSLQILANAPGNGNAALSYQGRIIFDQSDDLLKFFSGTDLGWIALDGTGQIDVVQLSNAVPNSTGEPITITTDTATDTVTITAHVYAGGSNIGFVPFSQAPGNSAKFLRGDAFFGTPAGDYVDWVLKVGASTTSIGGNPLGPDTVDLTGTAPLSSTLTGSDPNWDGNLFHDAQAVNPSTGTPKTINTSIVDSFVVATAITGDSVVGGHLTKLTTSTKSTSIIPNTDSLYNISASSVYITLKKQSTFVNAVGFIGTGGQVSSAPGGTNTIQIGLPAVVGIVNDLNVTSASGSVDVNADLSATSGSHIFRDTLDVTGIAALGISSNTPVISKVYADYAQSGAGSAEQWVNKIYVDTAAQTSIVFQGSYAANGTQSVPTGTAIEKGFAYAVTAGGTGNGTPFSWSPALDEGDFIYANVTDPSSQSDWTQIQNNIGKASNSAYGIARYLDANGWDTTMTKGQPVLKTRGADSGGTATAMPSLTMGTDNFGLVDSISNTNISITADITPASSQINDFNTASETVYDDYSSTFSLGGSATYTLTHNFDTTQVFVQIFDDNGNNVFADVTRPTVDTVFVEFSTAVAAGTPMKAICTSMTLA